MKRRCFVLVLTAAAVAITNHSQSSDIVNDTWQDGTRTDPASPTYSEHGVDGDLDGDLESAWFRGGAGTFAPIGPGGPLRLTQASASSSSLTTYFTAEGSEITLANPGDTLKLTWDFSLSGSIGANTSQGLRLALVDSPGASRVAADTSPGSAEYTGYAVFLNMSPTLSHSRPLELMERNAGVAALLSSGSAWAGIGSDGTSGNTGYSAGTLYTFMISLTRTAGGDLDILASMTGGSLDGDGSLSFAFTDTTPNAGSFSFDTFQFRPDGNDVTYDVFDTSRFRVEFFQVPEPSALALVGLGAFGLVIGRRRG